MHTAENGERRETAGNESLRQVINTLLFPAMNVLRGIELDIQSHPGCPYRDMAQKATANLMTLIEMVNRRDALPDVSAKEPDAVQP